MRKYAQVIKDEWATQFPERSGRNALPGFIYSVRTKPKVSALRSVIFSIRTPALVGACIDEHEVLAIVKLASRGPDVFVEGGRNGVEALRC